MPLWHPLVLAADQNVKWACAWGYSLYFLRLVGGGCSHPLWGARHPSYCKLSAVAHALSLGHSWAVFLDSDAMVRNASEASLSELIERYGGGRPSTLASFPQVFFAWDAPYSLGPNAGFFAVRNSPASRELLRAWWSLDPGPYGLSHAFEQQTLQWQLMHTARYRGLLKTLSLRAIDSSWPDAVCGASSKTRRLNPTPSPNSPALTPTSDPTPRYGTSTTMRVQRRASGTWRGRRPKCAQALSASYPFHSPPSTCLRALRLVCMQVLVGRGPSAVGSEAHRARNDSVSKLRRYLPLLQQTVRGKSMTVRQEMLRLVMASVGADLRRMGHPAPPRPNGSSVAITVASVAAANATVATSHAARGPSLWELPSEAAWPLVTPSAHCSGSVHVVPRFNSTESARRLLELSPLALQLASLPSANARPSMTVGGRSLQSTSAAWEGLPLQLRNCSRAVAEPLHAWQVWELKAEPAELRRRAWGAAAPLAQGSAKGVPQSRPSAKPAKIGLNGRGGGRRLGQRDEQLAQREAMAGVGRRLAAASRTSAAKAAPTFAFLDDNVEDGNDDEPSALDDDDSFFSTSPSAAATGASLSAAVGAHAFRLGLRHLSSACLTLGGTRAHKKPHVPLAVLSRCQPPPRHRGRPRSAEAAQAAVTLRANASLAQLLGGGGGGRRGSGIGGSGSGIGGSDSSGSPDSGRAPRATVGGIIRTTHPLATLRDLVPVFKRGCGFWPACTGVQTVRGPSLGMHCDWRLMALNFPQ